MNEKKYDLPNGKTAVFYYDDDGVGKITLECMDRIMEMLSCCQWIPCSEALPKDAEKEDGVPNPTVLFCTSKKVFMGYYSHGARCWWTVDGYSICEVIAWMPLPTSYSAPTHEQEGETNVR